MKRSGIKLSMPGLIYAGGVIVFGLFFFITLVPPDGVSPRRLPAKNQIINNLRQLDGAKEQWALENHQTGLVAVAREDLASYLKNGWVQDVAGEVYVINPNGVAPVAVLTRDVGDALPVGSILQLEGPVISGLGLPAETTSRRR